MSLLARFRAIDENGKAHAVRVLIERSTPNFDYFFMVALAIAMLTFGLIANDAPIIIAGMLISPVMSSLLSFSLGIVMSDFRLVARAASTIVKSVALALVVSVVVAFLFGIGGTSAGGLLGEAEPSLIYFLVAIIAGFAVSYALAKPEWNETLPGIAMSVALIEPLATVGMGLARLDFAAALAALALSLVNFIGVIIASVVCFSLMNLYSKRNVAESTIEREAQKVEEGRAAVAALDETERRTITRSTT